MYQIGNIYFITAIAVIGGALFGFDIASMSAMYVRSWVESTTADNTAVSVHNNTSATSTKVVTPLKARIAKVRMPVFKVESLLPCLVVLSLVL